MAESFMERYELQVNTQRQGNVKLLFIIANDETYMKKKVKSKCSLSSLQGVNESTKWY